MRSKSKKFVFVVLLAFLVIATSSGFGAVLIKDGFETGDFTGWSEVGTASSIDVTAEKSYTGSYSAYFKDPTSAFSGRGIESDYVSILSPDNYCFTLSAYFYVVNEGAGEITDTDLRVYVKWYDSGYTEIAGSESGYLSGEHLSAFDSWEKIGKIGMTLIAAPANASYARVAIDCKETVNNNNDVYVDDVVFESAVMPVYLKKVGLNVFDPSSDSELKVFFPFSTPAGKPSLARIVFNMENTPTTEVKANILIYDVMGRLVKTIVRDEQFQSTHYDYIWDGKDADQHYLPCGMYIISLEVADQDTGDVIRKQKVVAIGRKL
ncbi:MAG: hypothetical protein J7L54_07290 [Elusimicrobia bacterium]|nr:hypothetical protein [Elusimicrobiota bacterium]